MGNCFSSQSGDDEEGYDNPSGLRIEIRKDDDDAQLIKDTWRQFMNNVRENSTSVFIILVKKRPDYLNAFGIEGMSYDEIMRDRLIQKQALKMVYFIDEIVQKINQPDAINHIVMKIRDYYKNFRIPPAVLSDYKDCMIKYMLEKGTTDKLGAKAWHRFLDKTLKSL